MNFPSRVELQLLYQLPAVILARVSRIRRENYDIPETRNNPEKRVGTSSFLQGKFGIRTAPPFSFPNPGPNRFSHCVFDLIFELCQFISTRKILLNFYL